MIVHIREQLTQLEGGGFHDFPCPGDNITNDDGDSITDDDGDSLTDDTGDGITDDAEDRQRIMGREILQTTSSTYRTLVKAIASLQQIDNGDSITDDDGDNITDDDGDSITDEDGDNFTDDDGDSITDDDGDNITDEGRGGGWVCLGPEEALVVVQQLGVSS